MPHHRAKLTPRGGEQIVRLVVDQAMSYGQAAAWGRVSKSTVWEWVRRSAGSSAITTRRGVLSCSGKTTRWPRSMRGARRGTTRTPRARTPTAVILASLRRSKFSQVLSDRLRIAESGT